MVRCGEDEGKGGKWEDLSFWSGLDTFFSLVIHRHRALSFIIYHPVSMVVPGGCRGRKRLQAVPVPVPWLRDQCFCPDNGSRLWLLLG